MLIHPLRALKQTILGSLLVLCIEGFLAMMWSFYNVWCVWVLTGKQTWMFDFDSPLPQRTFVLFWWLLWTMPPFVGHILADWRVISRSAARRIVWAFVGLTVAGTLCVQITQ